MLADGVVGASGVEGGSTVGGKGGSSSIGVVPVFVSGGAAGVGTGSSLVGAALPWKVLVQGFVSVDPVPDRMVLGSP